MKKNLMWVAMPLVILAILFYTNIFYSLIPETKAHKTYTQPANEASLAEPEVHLMTNRNTGYHAHAKTDVSTEIIGYAETLIGSPYVYAGISPSGFDCSGFITHVFDRFGYDLPHSSAMQANEGIQVDRHDARKGDLVIFTGTNLDVREPGHVGIVISSPGQDIEFIHSSSNGGVKVSMVEGTRYNQRFLEIRRVL